MSKNNVLSSYMHHTTQKSNLDNQIIQDPNIQKVQKNVIYSDKTQHANFQPNSLYQATKPKHLNNS